MHSFDFGHLGLFWHLLTRLGEAQIALPLGAGAAVVLWLRGSGRPLVMRWVIALTFAIGLTTASKIAFIGWGIGWSAIDFTGISGHTMFATAIYPVIFFVFVSGQWRLGVRGALMLGYGLAFMIGVSRIAVGAHSPAEVVAGLLIGAGASAWAMSGSEFGFKWSWSWAPLLMSAWLGLAMFAMPPSQSHSLVTRLALKLSGHSVPYFRAPHYSEV